MSDLLLLTLLGGFLALDGTSVGQFMFSRPLVAATLAGSVLGASAEGFAVGALLEIYLLVSFPVGGSRFPEGGPAAVVGAAVAAWAPGPGGLALGIALGLVWGQLAGLSISVLRSANGHFAPDPSLGPVTAGAVVRGHLTAIGVDFVRGTIVTASGLLAGWSALGLEEVWPLAEADTRGLLLLGAAVSLGILLRSYGGLRRRALLFASGLVAGALGGVLL